MTLMIRRIDCAAEDALASLAELRQQLSPNGEVVSARGQELTRRLFGEVLTPIRSVERICNDVRSRGLEAVRHYSLVLDDFDLTPQSLRVAEAELARAHSQVAQTNADFLPMIHRVRQDILAFQTGILHRDVVQRVADRQEIRWRYRPIRRVGICVPGGAAAYPSTILMTALPAQAAGVPEIVVMAPPTAFGSNNPDILAVCKELGIREVYRLGGAHGVAALAYGVEGLPPVDMIVGPGNLFVTLAKRHVYGQVGIDMLAGPTEVVVLADQTSPAEYVAADLISQAEHAPGASILIAWDKQILDQVVAELEVQLQRLPRSALAAESLQRFGALIATRDREEALRLTNSIAPEHLHLCTQDAETLVDRIDNAGAIFVGPYTPVALGDYLAGPSHVLPTGGTARFASGLSANDFLRRGSVIHFRQSGLAARADDLRMLAEKEGLTGHSRSVDIRLEQS